MGSPLGPTFSDFYMCDLETRVLSNTELKPSTYFRYVDDIYVVVRSEEHPIEIKNEMQNNSILQFTYELSLNRTIPFLDVQISVKDGDEYVTKVYRKTTDLGKCINPQVECPERYKLGAVRAYLNREFQVCSSQEVIDTEIIKTKQILINSGFSNRAMDKEIARMRTNNESDINVINNINIFYKNQM